MSIEDNKAVIHRFVAEVVHAANIDALDELVAPEFVNHNPLPGLPADREGFKAVFRLLHGSLSGLHSLTDDLIAEGDRVVIPGGLGGTHTGEFLGVPPTGKDIVLDGITIFRLVDGRMTDRWAVLDNLGLMRQLGLLPAARPTGRPTTDPRMVAERWVQTLTAHDLEAAVACFAPDYHDEAPTRRGEFVQGNEKVRENFARLFQDIPDLRADLLRSVADGDTVWLEWRMQGTRRDGTPFEFAGVNLFGVRDEQFAWGRIYTELVRDTGGIDEQIERMIKG